MASFGSLDPPLVCIGSAASGFIRYELRLVGPLQQTSPYGFRFGKAQVSYFKSLTDNWDMSARNILHSGRKPG